MATSLTARRPSRYPSPGRDPYDRLLDRASLGRLVSAHGSDLLPPWPLGGFGMTCPRCQQDNLPHAKFCLECGTPVDAAASIQRSYAEVSSEIDRLKDEIEGLRRS